LNSARFGDRAWPGETLRLAMLRTHYRQPIDWTVNALEEAEKTLDRWYDAVGDVEPNAEVDEAFLAALDDDLNTPAALAELHRLAHAVSSEPAAALRAEKAARLKSSANLLGLLARTKSERDRLSGQPTAAELERLNALLAERAVARAAKNWIESDRLRDELAKMGVTIKDGKNGPTTWNFKR
jgi:cysteinyl-tRNA synthetase